MVEGLLQWLSENEKWLNLLISLLTLIMTSILTIIIIVQTGRLSKKQSKQESLLSKQQEELQKRQLKLDTFDYKNEIYESLYRVFQMTCEIYILCEKIDLNKKTSKQIFDAFNVYFEIFKIDVSKTLWQFKQAEYMFPPNISDVIQDISQNFDLMVGSVRGLEALKLILTDEEMNEYRIETIETVKECSDVIYEYIPFIESIMSKELKIYDLYR